MNYGLLIIVLVLFPSPVDGDCNRQQSDQLHTVVEYNGVLKCTLHETFCAMVYYLEYDRIAKNEDVFFVKLRCTRTGNLSHHAYVTFKDGDGINDDWYEPKIEVIHNCSPNKMIKRKEIYLNKVSIKFTSDKLNYTFDVSNSGQDHWRSEAYNMRFKEIYVGENTKNAEDFFNYKLKFDNYPSLFEKYDDFLEEC